MRMCVRTRTLARVYICVCAHPRERMGAASCEHSGGLRSGGAPPAGGTVVGGRLPSGCGDSHSADAG